MTRITFFPLGCADTSLVELKNGRRMLVDYADVRCDDDSSDRRCDLPTLLKADLRQAKRPGYAIVAFTHLDNDHCAGASAFFHFDVAAKYQGGDRSKIETLWVPAGAITEVGLEDDAGAIRREAQHRLKAGYGIKVFSRPERLEAWLAHHNLTLESRRHCLVDAGKLVPGLDLTMDGVEVFAHSPHALRTDERGLEDRNQDSLVFQMRFREGGNNTDVLFSGDVTYGVLEEIVKITKWHKNEDRLHWNVYHLPHHCSYLSIGPEKGDNKTIPISEVAWLCEEMGEPRGYIVSSSKPIPLKGTKDDDDVQPPHRQAAEYYRADVLANRNNLLVTMSEPSSSNPKPVVLAITSDGAVKIPAGSGGTAASAAVTAPRAG